MTKAELKKLETILAKLEALENQTRDKGRSGAHAGRESRTAAPVE